MRARAYSPRQCAALRACGLLRASVSGRFCATKAGRPPPPALCWRTHTCGELRRKDVGSDVTLCGWLDFKRLDRFAVLRDAYGAVQLTVEDKQLWQSVIDGAPLESVLMAEGSVRPRPTNMINHRMLTGEIEVVPYSVKVFNAVSEPLPFGTSARDDTTVRDEPTRLRHRHLDLRRAPMQHALRLRARLLHAARCALVPLGFVDVETPTLFRRTPGGAAEYPVPAGGGNRFYSLPQSPQQFKQLLMVAGVDRYFQVARCYRNERSTPDRQPEFTQLDIEMSFADAGHVMSAVEHVVDQSWPEELGASKPSVPFRRMSFADAMQQYVDL